MNLLPAWLASIFCLCAVITQESRAIDTTSPGPQEYLNLLIKISRESGLANKRTWQVLLHYRSDQLGSGVTSEIDDSEFFLARTGKTDPSAELEATLRAFFSSTKIGKDKLLPQCAFPARHEWLNSQLEFDDRFMPIPKCESIDLWREGINAESASLVFSSYYFNNPASMFGHTLIRINSADDAKPSLLDFAISYAADIGDTDNFFKYAWNGLTGGFKGRFSVYPYYDIVKQYNDLENRDLWEYQLNLSAEQIDFMLLHVWELVNTHFDFYFMRENCSYHLLSLLEVANPEFRLRDQYQAWTLPTETIKQVARQPGLVADVIRRPSLGTQLDQKMAGLNKQERRQVRQLTSSQDQGAIIEFGLLPPKQQAAIIDAAFNYIQYESYSDSKKAGELKSKMYALLVQRSQLPASNGNIQTQNVSDAVSPDQGHDPVRFEISGGRFEIDEDDIELDNESYLELSIQPGFHDLLSNEGGHAPNSQINFLNLRARQVTESEEWQVQAFTLVDIISLYPLGSFIKEPSWKINVGWERNQDNGCGNCTPFVVNPGIGLAIQTNLHRREVYFSFLEANLQSDHEFNSGHRAGFGATVGLLYDVTDQWRLSLIAKRTRFTSGQRGYVGEIELLQRYSLSRNTEVVFNLSAKEDYREGSLGIAYLF